MLWAITSYFNPVGYRTKKRNYDLFRNHLGVPLITVELGHNERFELGPDDADKLIQVPGGNVLWQKERLLNIALVHLPAECTAVAWLDADVVFENPDWPALSLAALERNCCVQLFEKIFLLKRHQTLAERDGLQTQFRSFACAHANGGLSSASLAARESKLKSGHAWAARRSILEQCGFYDAMVIGGGSRAILYAMLGEIETFCARSLLTPAHATHFRNWARRFFQLAQAQVGYLPGTIGHLWHGETEYRNYVDRQNILRESDFDPVLDIAHDPDGVWRWASDKPALHRQVAEYFESRKEDG